MRFSIAEMKIVLSFALLLVIALFLPISSGSSSLDGLDAGTVRLGLAFFCCIACLWMTEAIPLAITALLVPVLAAALGLTDIKTALTSFASPPIFLFFGGFALASALSAQGIDRWLAEKLARLGKGKFVPVVLLLFLGTALLSMWMSNTATTAMMLPLALGILNRFGEGENKVRNGWFLMLGLAYSASIGGLGTIVGSPPNGIAAKQLGVTFSEWIGFGIPIVAVLLPAMMGILYFMLRPSNPEVKGELIVDEAFHFTAPRIITLCIFALTAMSWIFSTKLTAWTSISDMDTWIALAAVFALAVARVVTWKQIESGTDWGVLLLFGGGIALSAILGSSGASLFMARLLGGIMDGWPLWGIIAAVVCFVVFLTELSSNTASAALLVPIFFTMATEFDLAPATLVLPLALAASCAFMLPVGTPPNAIVFGTGLIPQREMIRVGVVLNIIFTLLITVLAMVFL